MYPFGGLLALSNQNDLNTLACMRYRNEFGRKHVYSVVATQEKKPTDKLVPAMRHHGEKLFGRTWDYEKLLARFYRGYRLEEKNFNSAKEFKSWFETKSRQVLPLFALDPKGCIHFFTVDFTFQPGKGWQVVSMLPRSRRAAPAKTLVSKDQPA